MHAFRYSYGYRRGSFIFPRFIPAGLKCRRSGHSPREVASAREQNRRESVRVSEALLDYDFPSHVRVNRTSVRESSQIRERVRNTLSRFQDRRLLGLDSHGCYRVRHAIAVGPRYSSTNRYRDRVRRKSVVFDYNLNRGRMRRLATGFLRLSCAAIHDRDVGEQHCGCNDSQV
jgi:hypothetical protein